MTEVNKTFLFVDESGDPAFYASGNRSLINTEDFNPLLLIGMVKLSERKQIRNSILQFINELKNDPLYNTLPCITRQKDWFLHASYDNLEVRIKYAEFLRRLEGFEFNCIIGRKRSDIFHKKHNRNESEFYFDLLYHLIQGQLSDEATQYGIFLSSRNKNTKQKLKLSIDNAVKKDNEKRNIPLQINYYCEIVLSKNTPELSIADYLLWALQRYILLGDERFYKALGSKYNLIIDLYDQESKASNYYNQTNKFTIEKAGKFRRDGYI